MLTVLKSFGYAIEQLDGTLSNIMTMQPDVREWFARLEIWSEKNNTHHAHITHPKQSHPVPNRYAFSLLPLSPTPGQQEPPRSIRDTSRPVRKVAQVPEAVQHINKQDRVVEDLEVRREC
ncbi:hypothetical protein EV421DRAFT_1222812 [Armillaria borealis]|uniref:Uncharacterized protein n=1 Tax=Armillaria borealis TaxID=47425 RepID=A0AA39MJ75_9AGAR|nr:hypothetical protein EV421DRAFT_1222812 [Armillaria borealis]